MTGHKNNSHKKSILKFISNVVLILYLIFVAHMLFFSEDLDRTMLAKEYRYNLIPFSEIRRFWLYREQLGIRSFIINVFGNIVFFIPIGLLLPNVSAKKFLRNFFGIVFICALGSLVLEIMQMITKVGAFDVDDIILNTIGAAIGYLLFVLIRHFHKK